MDTAYQPSTQQYDDAKFHKRLLGPDVHQYNLNHEHAINDRMLNSKALYFTTNNYRYRQIWDKTWWNCVYVRVTNTARQCIGFVYLFALVLKEELHFPVYSHASRESLT